MNSFTLLLSLTVMLALCKHGFTAPTACKRRYMRRINGKCYYFSVVKLNWFGALNNCLRKGLVLAELANPADFYGVMNFLTTVHAQEDFWFAGNDLQTEGRFQYITSARLVRYFSNYSIIDPAEASECDDCLEVRVRSKFSVVADDNCLERQYFICTERYCEDGNVKKKLHHSHEHLHHFHHDIEVEDNEDEEDNYYTSSDNGWDEIPSGINGGNEDDQKVDQETPPWGPQEVISTGGANKGNEGGGEGVDRKAEGANGSKVVDLLSADTNKKNTIVNGKVPGVSTTEEEQHFE